jgi:uncharacterized protein YjaG (DUF416 family)
MVGIILVTIFDEDQATKENRMKYQDFVETFRENVYAMRYERQLALAIDVCKKLYPDYASFSIKYDWGDRDVLLDAIKLVEHSTVGSIDQTEIERLLVQLDAITPDMDDFGDDWLGSYALNVSVAVINALQFLLDRDPRHIYDIGECLTDTIDFKIHEIDETSEEDTDNHSLMAEARNYLLQWST